MDRRAYSQQSASPVKRRHVIGSGDRAPTRAQRRDRHCPKRG